MRQTTPGQARSGRPGVPPRPGGARWLRLAVVTLVCGGAAAGCGGASSSSTTSAAPKDAAQVVCAHARDAARSAARRAVSLRFVNRDPANIECVLRVSGTRLDLVAQQSARAWEQFDTVQVHQEQAYGPSANHQQAQIPQNVNMQGGQAQWIPAQRMLFATNGTQSQGGSYVTVTVKGRRHHEVKLAQAVTQAALKAAPKGPNLVPPS
jgi:hypothetical protein